MQFGGDHRLSVVFVTGIYPPDIGGPATHVSDVARELRRRGHEVTIVALTDEATVVRQPDLLRFPRRWPWPVRMAAVTWWLLRHRHNYEIVYAAGLHAAAVLGSRLARRSVVVRVAGDPAWERGSRLRLTNATFDEFQEARRVSPRVEAMRWLRDRSVRAATTVVAPNPQLQQTVAGWVGDPAKVAVIPNGVRVGVVPGDQLGRVNDELGELRALFVGRLVGVKRVDVLIEAVSRLDSVSLDIVGDGPERQTLKCLARDRGAGERVCFCGPLAHDEVLRRLTSVDVFLSASTWEGLPHTVLEALATGVPVVASAAGGTEEAVLDGVNGLVVDPPTVGGFAEALATLRDQPELRRGLSHGARSGATGWRLERCVDDVEALLRRALRVPPKIVFVGKSAMADPPSRGLEPKLDLLARELDATIVAVGAPGVRRRRGVRLVALPALRPPLLAGILFYTIAPALAVMLAASQRRGTVVCQSPYEGLGVVVWSRLLPLSVRPRVVVELHGDWSSGPRLYGGRFRRLIAPASDRASEWALRRAQRVRTASRALEALARRSGYTGEVDRFVTFSDFRTFLNDPPAAFPSSPRAAFVGALQPVKGVDVLLEAWAEVVDQLPAAHLLIAGSGPLLDRLVARTADLNLSTAVSFLGPLDGNQVRELLDSASCLVLPSRAEGLGRVILESMARGRPAIASDTGGITELVDPGYDGLLVPPEDRDALSRALVELLSDLPRARRMGERARLRVDQRDPVSEYEAGISRLAAWAGRT